VIAVALTPAAAQGAQSASQQLADLDLREKRG
jgi:hypothetical protein